MRRFGILCQIVGWVTFVTQHRSAGRLSTHVTQHRLMMVLGCQTTGNPTYAGCSVIVNFFAHETHAAEGNRKNRPTQSRARRFVLRAAVFCRLPVSVLLGCRIAGIPTFTDLVGTGICPRNPQSRVGTVLCPRNPHHRGE